MLGHFFVGSIALVSPAEPASSIDLVVLKSPDVQVGLLERELALRSPGRRILDFDANAAAWVDERGWAFVLVERRADGYALTVILGDGRAYDRTVEADAEQAPRAVAAALANLLAAIVEDRVEPDREDVAIDAAVGEVRGDPADGGGGTDPKPSGEATSGGGEGSPPGVDTTAPGAGGDAPPAWSLAPHVAGAGLVGLGVPQEAGAWLGAGGGLGVAARAPRGALVGVDVRVVGRGRAGYSLVRTRIAVTAGYGLRRGRFALDVAGVVAVEPWGVRSKGERIAVLGESDEAPALALGGGVRVLPALLVPLGKGPRLGVGLLVEIGYAGVIQDGLLKAARLSLPGAEGGDPTPLFRVGGVEAALGLDLALHFDLAPRR